MDPASPKSESLTEKLLRLYFEHAGSGAAPGAAIGAATWLLDSSRDVISNVEPGQAGVGTAVVSGLLIGVTTKAVGATRQLLGSRRAARVEALHSMARQAYGQISARVNQAAEAYEAQVISFAEARRQVRNALGLPGGGLWSRWRNR